MFKRAVNFIRTAPRYLLLAGLALVLGFLILGGDVVFNKPDKDMQITIRFKQKETGQTSDYPNGPWVDQQWAFRAFGGVYGLFGFTQSHSTRRSTEIWFGSNNHRVSLCIYTIFGSANCFLFAGVILVAGLVRRKRK